MHQAISEIVTLLGAAGTILILSIGVAAVIFSISRFRP